VKIRILREFADIHTSQLYSVGDVLEVSEKRYEEMLENLSAYGEDFLEKIEEATTEKEVAEDETVQD
jgi:hypothetical protein